MMLHFMYRCLVFSATTCTVTYQQGPTHGGIAQRSFRRQTSPRRGPVRLSSKWYVKTRALCAEFCMNVYPDHCKTFLFNALSGACVPGSWVQDRQPLPEQAEGDLYYASCNESQGFRMYEEGTTRACIGVFKPPLNYTNADSTCSQKGAFLMSVKTLDKLSLMQNFKSFPFIWVGCDSIGRQLEYLWKEDGEKLTNETIAQVFEKGDPYNFRGRQYCIGIATVTKTLIDSPCKLKNVYACEIPIP